MSGDAGLERGYRRLLACYPRRFRDEHGEELLAVLLADAADGQHRPGVLESADLVRNGLGMRLRPDVSRSARQGWSDALAAYSLAAPVLLLLTTVTTFLLLLSVNSYPPAMSLIWPGLCVTVAIEAVIIVPVIAGRRKTALAALVLAAAMVILILALNRLGRALRLSRYFRLLLAATFYPTIFITATIDLGGIRLLNDLDHLGSPAALVLFLAGPLLCAAVAIGTAIRPRRRRII